MLGEEKGLEATELSLGLKTSINSAHISALKLLFTESEKWESNHSWFHYKHKHTYAAESFSLSIAINARNLSQESKKRVLGLQEFRKPVGIKY